MALSRPFKEDRLALPVFQRLSPPGDQWCDVLGFLPFWGLLCLPVYLLFPISLHSGMSRAVHPQEFPKVDVDHRHIDWTVVVQPEPGRFRWGIDDLCLLCG